MLRITLLLTLCASITACAAIGPSAGKNVDWDPPQGQALFDQIPAWDGAAEKLCCGHLRTCKPHQSPRC